MSNDACERQKLLELTVYSLPTTPGLVHIGRIRIRNTAVQIYHYEGLLFMSFALSGTLDFSK